MKNSQINGKSKFVEARKNSRVGHFAFSLASRVTEKTYSDFINELKGRERIKKMDPKAFIDICEFCKAYLFASSYETLWRLYQSEILTIDQIMEICKKIDSKKS